MDGWWLWKVGNIYNMLGIWGQMICYLDIIELK